MGTRSRADGKQDHPIQVVARRTGLTPEVLRIWEKRYGVVTPVRTGTGRRLYSEEDIECLRLLRLATLSGRRIGDVATLSALQLRRLVAEDQAAETAAPPGRVATTAILHRGSSYLSSALAALEGLNARDLESLLTRALLELGAPTFLEEVIAPLVRRIGDLWHAGRLEPFEEHFATSVIRRILTEAMMDASGPRTAPVLLVATPTGEHHELGALMAGALAAAEGWRVVYLGTNLPAADIAGAAQRVRAAAVALSLVYLADAPGIPGELRHLRKRLPDLPILAGGAACIAYDSALSSIGATVLDDLSQLPPALRSFTASRRHAPEDPT
jgi:DNA-binding transcriptional MerR regulator/methylmalonyl-CoA mutase cobalamin-binding subunit